jgi:hypothetical protein
MKRYLVVYLLVMSLTVQCSQSSEEEMGNIKNKRNSDKARKALSQQVIAIKDQDGKNKLSHSDPIAIPKKAKKNEDFLELTLSPRQDGKELSFGDYFTAQGSSPSPWDYNSLPK